MRAFAGIDLCSRETWLSSRGTWLHSTGWPKPPVFATSVRVLHPFERMDEDLSASPAVQRSVTDVISAPVYKLVAHTPRLFVALRALCKERECLAPGWLLVFIFSALIAPPVCSKREGWSSLGYCDHACPYYESERRDFARVFLGNKVTNCGKIVSERHLRQHVTLQKKSLPAAFYHKNPKLSFR